MSTNESPTLPSCDEFDPNAVLFDEALNKILASVSTVKETEILGIRKALGHILATEISSKINVPSYTNSAMDGYAIAGSDIPEHGTVTLKLNGSVFAGTPLQHSIHSGECARIMTGGKLPAGTDTVVMQEHVTRDKDMITITCGHKTGQNVRAAGDDLKQGDIVFTPGRQLTPADIGMIASMGYGDVHVTRPLKVAFFSTGDELCGIGEALSDGQIYDSNRYSLYGMLNRLGADIIDMGIIPDQRDQIEAAFQSAAAQADVLITSGGVSVGEADFVKETLDKLGQVGFWKIAIKPGRPLAFGNIEGCQFFGLPGNPVSAMVTFYQFVQPALKRMMGLDDVKPKYVQVKTRSTLKKNPGRLEFQRGVVSRDDNGELVVDSTGGQGSHLLSSMGRANCFIILALECTEVAAGEMVKVQTFDGLI